MAIHPCAVRRPTRHTIVQPNLASAMLVQLEIIAVIADCR
jgi:hypothetical protein